jgi:hypothetical protein
MNKPKESDYTSRVDYIRDLERYYDEKYCADLQKEEQKLDEKYGDDINVYIDQRDLKLKDKNR